MQRLHGGSSALCSLPVSGKERASVALVSVDGGPRPGSCSTPGRSRTQPQRRCRVLAAQSSSTPVLVRRQDVQHMLQDKITRTDS